MACNPECTAWCCNVYAEPPQSAPHQAFYVEFQRGGKTTASTPQFTEYRHALIAAATNADAQDEIRVYGFSWERERWEVVAGGDVVASSAPRKRGRPEGTGRPLKSEAEKQPRRTVAMTDDLWGFCTSQPEGAGAFIRGLVEKERKSQCTKTRRRLGS